MKAIILAAGRGSRMGSATANMPKCMMTLNGRTLLMHCVDSIKQAGFALSDIGIVTGYKAEEIKVDGVQFFHNENWESTNMFVSLTMAEEWLKNEPCIVSYSDIVFSPEVVKLLMETNSELAITYYTGFWELWQKRFINPLDDLETFKEHDGKLLEIGKKPKNKEDVQGQYMGLLRFTPDGWEKVIESLPASKPTNKLDMTTLLQHLITCGHVIQTIKTSDLWLECDNQNDIEVYEREFITQCSKV
ncbi:MAG: phosphocholine cytidylyltransferase family protein [Oscillospiraceae bacterium]|nr:phosphocholine cytidylyltransferase family protein [Oscillospiraceae bacterium]